MADHGHGHGAHANGAHANGAHGHGHVDTSGDKGAAFVGLFAGMVVLGAMLYGMVMWTNAQFAGHGEGGERPAGAAETR